MPNNLSVVPVTATTCKPRLFEVMVFDPGSGFKFQVLVERSCIKATPETPAATKWKLVFDLYKKKANSAEFDHIVHVSYTAENPAEEKKAAKTRLGINQAQADHLVNRVEPAVRAAEDIASLPPAEAEQVKATIKKEMKAAVNLAL